MSPHTEMDVDVLVRQSGSSKSPPSPLPPLASSQNGKTNSPSTETPATTATALPLSPTSSSASALAALLSSTLAQVDSLKEKLKKEKRRADHYEGLATDYKDLLGEVAESEPEKKQGDGGEEKPDASMESTAPSVANQLANAAEKIRQLRESVAAAEEIRDEEMARRIALTDLWAQLNQYIDRLESAGRDARAGFDRVVKQGGGVIREYSATFKDIPQLADGDLMRVERHYNANGVLQSLAPPRREYSHGTRRPRSGSMDAYAYGHGPNSKRVRYQEDHHPQVYYQHPPPPGNSLSPPTHLQQHQHVMQNMPFAQGQPQPPPLTGTSSGSGPGSRHRHGDPPTMPPPSDHMYVVPGPPGYEQIRPHEHHPDDRRIRRRGRSRSFSHGRSPSRGSEASLDLDEMLLAATSADEQTLQANGSGPGQPQALIPSRRKGRSHPSGLVYDPRDGGAQFVHQLPPHTLSPHAQHLAAQHSSQHLIGGPPPPSQYPQTSSGRHSPTGSRPSSSRRPREGLRSEPTLRDVPEGSLGHVATGPGQVQYQTHVFAPVQTGAPVKKTKFNNTGANSSPNVAEEPHSNSPAPNPPPVAIATSTSSLPLASVNLAPATSPFPPTNEQGQRICRQCGMPGRYKEGKCVEKWGPGPMGPGTVCDRCRKKMKRVERRGTIEQAQLLAAQQAQNRTQPNIGNASSYGSFTAPQREGSNAKLGRTDTVIVDSRDGGRLTYDEPSVSSIRSTSSARVVTSNPFSKSSKTGSRATSKAASRAGSIVDGSKPSRSPIPSSRSNLGPSSVSTTNARTHASTASVHSNGSGSGMDIDADADAEADLDDAEAEVEGDLAALVDQAASPPHPGSRHTRGHDEDADIAVLAGVDDDDDPDDYDSPATMNALKRQQATRVGGVGSAPPNEVAPGSSSTSADGDAELDILEAVDAAEANSAASSSGLKAEDV